MVLLGFVEEDGRDSRVANPAERRKLSAKAGEVLTCRKVNLGVVFDNPRPKDQNDKQVLLGYDVVTKLEKAGKIKEIKGS